ncbi:I78 family peptidase inhibitor [Kitasatospora sp. NPDC048540]|uniref:I78 family peptidase inhibitor n=1 Tax=unclassified Kitasatospora TaxID=2633591 RepID=UPI000539EC73|nr:I78 family peptidase inhibitor [Kitasatospora sp. MBT63]
MSGTAQYVGLPVERARELAVRLGVETVRELAPGALITLEYRADRLNLLVRDGVVERAWQG